MNEVFREKSRLRYVTRQSAVKIGLRNITFTAVKSTLVIVHLLMFDF